MPSETGVAAGWGVGGGAQGGFAGVEVQPAFAAGDTGVEQFAAEQALGVVVQGEGDVRVFGALGFVDAERVGVGKAGAVEAGERHGGVVGQVQL